MREVVGFPLWFVLTLAVLLLAREIASAVRDDAMQKLWKLYCEQTNREDGSPTPAPQEDAR